MAALWKVARSGQDKLGQLMARTHQSEVEYESVSFPCFDGEWIRPKQCRRRGVILYLHGGGYVAGDIDYAKGYGTILCAKNGMEVFVRHIVWRRKLLFPPLWKTRRQLINIFWIVDMRSRKSCFAANRPEVGSFMR